MFYQVFLPPTSLCPLPVRDAALVSPVRFYALPDVKAGGSQSLPHRDERIAHAAASAGWSLGTGMGMESGLGAGVEIGTGSRRENLSGRSRSRRHGGHAELESLKEVGKEEKDSWERSVLPGAVKSQEKPSQLGYSGEQEGLEGSDHAAQSQAGKRKRRRSEDASCYVPHERILDGLTTGHPPEERRDGELPQAILTQDRRRSQRLGRTTVSLLNALPQLDPSESILSLNTTTSGPSQLDSFCLPRWHVPISKLSSLHALLAASERTDGDLTSRLARPPATRTRNVRQDGLGPGHKHLVTLLACVTAVEAAVLRRRKEEREQGKEGTLWVGSWRVVVTPISRVEARIEARDAAGNQGVGQPGFGEVGCGVKLWESCAREWADGAVRKGDVVLLENAEFKPATWKDPPQLVLSPGSAHTPKVTILYRTLPRYEARTGDYISSRKEQGHVTGQREEPTMLAEDRAFRPDLRLGRSDPGMRRVMEYAKWFAGWVGGEAPP